MTERDQETDEQRSATSPPDPTHGATTPPGNPDVDQEAVEKGEDNLGQAGGGH
jgi:hypothetical protein